MRQDLAVQRLQTANQNAHGEECLPGILSGGLTERDQKGERYHRRAYMVRCSNPSSLVHHLTVTSCDRCDNNFTQ